MDQWSEEFTQIQTDGSTTDTQLIKYVAQIDGWGQVSTPIGTYNCLRLVAARSVYNPSTFQWIGIDNDFTWLADSIGVVFQVEGYHFDNLVGDHVGIVRYYDPTNVGIEKNQNMLADMDVTLHPNPLINSTTIGFTIGRQAHVDLSVYDAAGKLIRILVEGHLQPGDYETKWKPENVQPGVYSCVLQMDEAVISRRMVLLK